MSRQRENHRSGEERANPRTPARRLWYTAAAALVVVWLAAAGPLGSLMGSLSDVQDNDASTFLPVDAESTEVREIQSEFGNANVVPAIAVYTSEEPFDARLLGEIAGTTDEVADQPWVEGEVVGPVPGTEDERVAQVVVPLSEQADTEQAVSELRETLTADTPEGVQTQLTGPAAISADLAAAFGGIDSTLLVVAVVAVLVILIAVYRSPLLPLVVITAALLALVLAAAVVYYMASAGWVDLNGQSQGILFILVVGACTDYALLLVARYRESLQEYARPFDALAVALRGTLGPILASGGTVILGVLCLLASDLSSNRSLGPVAAFGIAAAMVSALTFLPAGLLLLGRSAFWPFRPVLRDTSAPLSQEGSVASEEPAFRSHPLWGRIAQAVARRPRSYWVTTVVLLAVAAAFVPQFRAEGTSQLDVFRSDVESVTGQEELERGFGADASAVPAVIVADSAHTDAVTAAAQDVSGVSDVTPGGDGGALSAGGSADGQEPQTVEGQVLLNAQLDAPAESAEAVDIVDELRSAVHEVPDAEAMVGGTAAVNLDTLETSQRDLQVVIPLVLLVVLAVLVLLLRSLVAPLLLVATTVLSFGAALGVGALVFNHVLDLPGADPVVPLFAFVFLVALGIDYNIFLMTRAREEALRHGHRAGVLRALTLTGGVITSAGVVLAATFAALAVLPILFLLQLAFLVAFGVLLDALLVRSLLVPALSLDIGRRTWWPGRLARGRGGSLS